MSAKKEEMRTERKTNIQNSVGRFALAAFSFLLQLAWLIGIGIALQNYLIPMNAVLEAIAVILSLWIFNRRDTNASFKLLWIILLLTVPIFGMSLFVLFGHKYSRKVRKKMKEIHEKCLASVCCEGVGDEELSKIDKGISNQFRYLRKVESFPAYNCCEVMYFEDAAEGYEQIILEASKAESFIYLEYHAIQDAIAFERLHKILVEKASTGLDVRIMYDDVGSVGFLNNSFAKKLNAEGIKCKAFNKITPAFRLYMNNRDHRKISVIDGKVAFTGGFNLADEYFNITHPYGTWKDTGVRIRGKAVSSFLCMFLEMWNSSENELEDFSSFGKITYEDYAEEGIVLPYADSPLDTSRVGENVYLNLISHAKDKVYITTPYLVISDEMKRALEMAANRGVDIRIVTPGIPDKKIVYMLTRSYYQTLIKEGVKIYEYTPGFIHCKQYLVDDEIAAVGTINMDYRSLYHHFENGVLIYQNSSLKDIAADFEKMFVESRQIGEEFLKKQSWWTRFVGAMLRVLAPIM